MNSQTIKLVSSLITKNPYNLILVSKFLFQQIRINDVYLELVCNYISSESLGSKESGTIRLKYFLELCKELINLNHTFSVIMLSKLHDLDYRYRYIIDLDLVKDLNELGLISKYNFDKNFYRTGDYKLSKYLISIGFINIKKVMSVACMYSDLELAEMLIEELNMKLTRKNSIYECKVYTNIEFIKYLFSKLPKHKLNYQKIIIKVSQDCNSSIMEYLMKDLKITIEKSTIEKILDKNDSRNIMDLIKNNYIIPDQEIFNKAIELKNLELIGYLYCNYKFNISKENKNNLFRNYIETYISKKDIKFFLLDIIKENN